MDNSSKHTKNAFATWITIALVFIVIIIFMLVSFITKGMDNAEEQTQEQLIYQTNVWADRVHKEFDRALDAGNVMASVLKNEKISLEDERTTQYMQSIVNNTPFYMIMACQGGKVVSCSSKANHTDYDLSFLTDKDADKPGYYYLKDDGITGQSCVAITVPTTQDNNSCFIFFYDLTELKEIIELTTFEENAFVVLFHKEGTIYDYIIQDDAGSSFLVDGNLLTGIAAGAEYKELYNMFKVKLYNDIGCAIPVEYKEEARTIACYSVGIDDWYIGFGVKQIYVDKLVTKSFSVTKTTAQRLIITISIFALFVVTVGAVNTIASKERGKKLEDKADTDLLTDLNNKVATERKIQEYIDDNPNSRALMFVLDIDNFKKVNDTMGHAFGDELLRTLGKEIRAEFRLSDIIGRTGGDEFIIFLKDVTDDLIVEREAKRVSRFFHDFKAGGDYVKYSATASIGAAIYPDDAKSFKDLYVVADQALYKAKKRGKNQLAFYNEEDRK